jgi:hypothetical protein
MLGKFYGNLNQGLALWMLLVPLPNIPLYEDL